LKVILGIGNPGRKYARTRHNAGFLVLDRLAESIGASLDERRFRADFGRGRLEGESVLLVKPQTYVNLSGEAARALLGYYKAPVSDLLVIVDDVNLSVGLLRARARGSAGGHNGLKSIIQQLGTEQFARLRLGVGGERHPDHELADYVLGRFEADEEESFTAAAERACSACRVWVSEGIDECMNRFNGTESD
jgi:PTH1 family peptidyl-tRNA hydrolase